ncbi:MAG: TonB-dependent receptor [Salinivirgaceae bacterium]|nr:TonB-dependent receptor [Salinivirgaceae bacterium]
MNTKLLLFLALLFGLTSIFNLSAQEILHSKLNQDFTGKPLLEFLLVAEHDYPVHFFYKKEWIQRVVITSGKVGLSIRDILEAALTPHQLSFLVIQEQNIILIPEGYTYFMNGQKVEFYRVVGNPMEKGKYSLNKVEGHVYFGKTGEPLPGAVILDKKHHLQTTSDLKGYYNLNLPSGVTKLQFSFMGLETLELEVEVMSPGKMDVELMESPIELESVTVTADGGKNNVERTQMGLVHLDIKNINKLPVLMGEADIIKSMTLLPGVQTAGEMAAGFNVRGGNTDQNLILINDAPIYGTSHLFGMFSTLIPGAINSVNLHKGTQPANYGSRVASVMEIKLKNPDTTKIKGKAGIGILNSTFFVEGPIWKNRVSFLLGARTTYSNWILKKVPDLDIRKSKASFYDLIGKVDVKLNSNNTLGVFGYGSHDLFTYSNKNDYAYSSFIGGINHNGIVNPMLSVHTSASYSSYKNEVGYFEVTYPAYLIKSGIEQLNLRTEWNLHLPKNEIVTGFEGIGYSIEPGEQEKYNEDSEALTAILEKEKALELAAFVQDNFKISDRWSLFGGLRYSWYSKIGEAQTYVYEDGKPINDNTVVDTIEFSENEFIKPYQGLEPRFGLKFGIDETSSLKLGYHITRQYQHLISNTAASTPADYWKSADQNIEPILNQQVSLGYFKNFMGNIIETSVEGYYKTSDHVLEYKNGAVLNMNPTIERDLIDGVSKSYGLEFMVRKSMGDFTGWLSYTLSKSLIKTESAFQEEVINQGRYYPTYTDRKHDLSVSVNYQLTRRWTFGSNFILTSGRPVTLPEKKYTIHQVEVVEFSDRNEYRLPAYHRLDLSVTYEGFLNKTKKVHPSFTFSVYNLYGHKNIYSVYYKQDKPTSSNNYQRFALYQLSIIGVPIPSLTINLSF